MYDQEFYGSAVAFESIEHGRTLTRTLVIVNSGTLTNQVVTITQATECFYSAPLSRDDSIENGLEGDRDRLGRCHRRPADGSGVRDTKPFLLCCLDVRSGRRDADQCARDARDPQAHC
jgi:hypothetical protein